MLSNNWIESRTKRLDCLCLLVFLHRDPSICCCAFTATSFIPRVTRGMWKTVWQFPWAFSLAQITTWKYCDIPSDRVDCAGMWSCSRTAWRVFWSSPCLTYDVGVSADSWQTGHVRYRPHTVIPPVGFHQTAACSKFGARHFENCSFSFCGLLHSNHLFLFIFIFSLIISVWKGSLWEMWQQTK